MKGFSLKNGEKAKVSTFLMSETISAYMVKANDTSKEKKKEIAKSYPRCASEAEFWRHHIDYLKQQEGAVKTLVANKLKSLQN